MNYRWLRGSILYILIIVAVVAIFFAFFSPGGGAKDIPLNQVIEWVKQGKVSKVEISGDSLTLTTKEGTFRSRKEEGTSIYEILDIAGVNPEASGVEIVVKSSGGWGNIFGIFLNFLPLIFFGAILLFMMRQAQGTNSQAMSFGRSRARMFVANRPTVTFADVAGVDEAKLELQEVVEFLRFPERFTSMGARIPKGVLLVGLPGTGKTLLSRAVAGEAGVPFFSISGSEFVEMFVGVGAARVRDLFDQAKRNAPCIVFVDEIDAVGRHRGAGLGGGHDEREQTLNQILVEMDGFDVNTNVIVLAATNRPDILDPALLRPGRFDRRVVLDPPDVLGRTQILKVHAKGKPLAEDVSLETIAKQTPGFSGADLANLVNEAAILAARRNKKLVGTLELEEAIDRVIAGPERKSRLISQREKEITAYHEAGHALVGRMLPHADPVHKISIVSRGSMGGYTRFLPPEDRYLWTKNQFEDMLAASLGGRVAEELIFNETTTGASNDLENATGIARKMVTAYGMSDRAHYEEVAFSDVVEKVLAGNVESIEVYGDDLLVHTKDGHTFQSRKEQRMSLVEFLQSLKSSAGVNSAKVYVKGSTGLGGLVPRTFGKREELVFLGREISEQRDYGDRVAEQIDEEIAAILDKALGKATEILASHKGKLHQVARYLIAHETVEGEDLNVLFNSPVPEEISSATS